MNEEKVLIDNLKINYKVAGFGPAILILHGWGGSSDSWLKVQEILAQKGYKVICPDLPGFGKSKTPPTPWGIDDYTEWLNGFLNSQKLEKIFLFGHSFGGRIAIRFAKKNSEKIKKLILCDSAGIKQKPTLNTKIFFWLAKTGNAILSPRILKRFKDSIRNLFYIFLRHRDYVKAKGVMKETIKKVLDEDLLTDLSDVKTETLIVWGQKDKIVPLKIAYIFKEKIKNSNLEILPKLGHSPHLEAPEKLAKVIVLFLKP
ncbi:hypothetical protein AMJ49_03320 [Parcubacteria bacterium DG_74_2]|nr:MAG: hypothetical protein AMJ49_03320 [Parcubacteria bacterium DG_74_2]